MITAGRLRTRMGISRAYAWTALAFVLACATPPPPVPPTSPSPLLGVPLPSFRRPTITGANFDTASTAGRIVVVDFFAAYCQPCQRSLPDLVRLQARRGDIVVIGISLDDDPALAEAQARHYGMGFPVIHDAGRALAGRFRVTELPATFIASPRGRIHWVGGPGAPPDAAALVVDQLGRHQGGAQTAE